MQKMSLANLRPGMVVGRHIYGSDGRLLLNTGTVLTEAFINRLKKKWLRLNLYKKQLP